MLINDGVGGTRCFDISRLYAYHKIMGVTAIFSLCKMHHVKSSEELINFNNHHNKSNSYLKMTTSSKRFPSSIKTIV